MLVLDRVYVECGVENFKLVRASLIRRARICLLRQTRLF